MFDLISGAPRHPFHGRTMTPTLLSVVGHGVIVMTIVVFPLMYATDRLPEVPTMLAFVAPEPPPPPPPPAVVKPAAAQAHPVAPMVGTGFAAPVEAPSGIHPELPAPVGAIEGGVEGGIPGGVAGGIVGGLLTVAAPPPPPPPPPPVRPEPVRIGGAILAPAIVHRVEPTYPEIALVAKVTGIVILEATVDSAGSVGSVRVLRSVKLLDQSAIEAVKQWQYSPLVLNGVPTPFVLTVTVSFNFKT